MTSIFVGIDVACGRGKRLPICFVETGERLRPLASRADLADFPLGPGNVEIEQPNPFAETARKVSDEIVALATREGWRIERIAIDAPAAPPRKGERRSELALRERRMSVFSTPTDEKWRQIVASCKAHLDRGESPARLPHANKIWMLYGFELYRGLRERLKVPVIETYPYAIVRSLILNPQHKKQDAGYQSQLEAVAARTGWPTGGELEDALKASVPGTRDDRLDAFMAAWVASLSDADLHAYGDRSDPDDSVWGPPLAR